MNLLTNYLKEIESTLSPKTVADYSVRLGHFEKWLAGRTKFDRQAALGFITYLRDMQYGKASVAAHKVAVSAFYTWLMENDHIAKNPVRDLSVGNYRSKPKADDAAFTAEEYTKIKEAIRASKLRYEFWEGAVIIAWNTGLRMGDIACMEKAEIDLEGCKIVITPNKTRRFDKELCIPMTDEVYDYIAKRLPTVPGDRLFQRMCEQYSTDGAKSLSKQFERICAKAGIKGKSFHCLRHAHISRLMNAGVPLPVVTSITGNTMVVLQRYSHVSHEQRVKAMEAIV